jgi:hypothetical protein
MDRYSCVQTPGTECSNTGSECTTIYQDQHTSTHPAQSWTTQHSTSSRYTLSVQIRVREFRVLPTSGEGATMEVRHQERDEILSGGQERYEGRMPPLPALLPQDPY